MIRAQSFQTQLLTRFTSMSLESIFRAVLVVLMVMPMIGTQFSDALFLSDDQIHFPVPGLEFLAEPLVLFVTGWMLLLFGGFTFLGLWLRGSILVLGISSLAFWLGSTENRFAFSYYLPLAMVAYGLQTLTRSNRRLTVVFIGTVYLTAAIHKIIVFPTMIDFLPASIQQMFVHGFTSSHGEMSNLLAHMFGWTVVPVELSMGLFFLFARTRRFAFVLACIFHSMIGVINHGNAKLWSVGMSILAVHALAAVFGARVKPRTEMRIQDLARFPHGAFVVAVWGVAVAFYIFGAQSGFVHQLAEVMSLFFPLIAIAAWSYFGTGPWLSSTTPEAESEPPRFVLIGFSVFMVAWALAPFAMGHTNDHIGFAMFSGGSHKAPFHCFQIRGLLAPECPLVARRTPILLRRRIANDAIEYCSRQASSLEKFRAWSRKRCPALTIDEATYDVDPDSIPFLYQ